MSFEHALMDFIGKLKTEYGHKPLIKSIELNDELYRSVELELLEKMSKTPPGLYAVPCRIHLFFGNEIVDIKRSGQRGTGE